MEKPKTSRSAPLLAGLIITFVSGACASAISTTQSAETLAPGHVMVSAGNNVSIPASRIVDTLDAASNLEEKLRADPNYQFTDQERATYEDAVLGLALNQPGVAADFMVRYGIAKHLDAGLRYSTTGVHLDAKYQFLDRRPSGWHGAVSLGVRRHVFSGLIFDVLEKVDIKDFSRTDLELPLLFGRSFRQKIGGGLALSGRTWFGPKLILSKVSVDAKLGAVDETLSLNERMYYLGGVAGGSFGLSPIELFAELTVMNLVAKPTIANRQRDLGGVMIMPTVGIQARF